jgi:hypothetical protein
VDDPETQLDTHLQPSHGISSGCSPAYLDASTHSSRSQDEGSHCIPLKETLAEGTTSKSLAWREPCGVAQVQCEMG